MLELLSENSRLPSAHSVACPTVQGPGLDKAPAFIKHLMFAICPVPGDLERHTCTRDKQMPL